MTISDDVMRRFESFCERSHISPEAMMTAIEDADGVPGPSIVGGVAQGLLAGGRPGERAIRKQLRKWADAKPEMKAAIDDLLADEIKFDLFYDQVTVSGGLYVDDNLLLGDGTLVDNVLKLFQWVLDHQDQILAFIKAIVAMFAGV